MNELEKFKSELEKLKIKKAEIDHLIYLKELEYSEYVKYKNFNLLLDMFKNKMGDLIK